jgi:hypothetical protein
MLSEGARVSGVAVLAVCVVMAATGCALIFASTYRRRHGVLRSQRLEWALKPRPVPGWMYLIGAGIAILAGIPNVAGAIVTFGRGSSSSASYQLVYGLFFLGVGVSTILTMRASNRGKPPRERFKTGLFGMGVFVLGGCAFAVWGANRGHVLAVIVGIVVACSFPLVAAAGWLRLRRGDTVQ